MRHFRCHAAAQNCAVTVRLRRIIKQQLGDAFVATIGNVAAGSVPREQALLDLDALRFGLVLSEADPGHFGAGSGDARHDTDVEGAAGQPFVALQFTGNHFGCDMRLDTFGVALAPTVLVLSMMLSNCGAFIFCKMLTRSRSAPCIRPSSISTVWAAVPALQHAVKNSTHESESQARSQFERLLETAIELGCVFNAVASETLSQANQLWHFHKSIPLAQALEGLSLKRDISIPVSSIPNFLRTTDVCSKTPFPGCAWSTAANWVTAICTTTCKHPRP